MKQLLLFITLFLCVNSTYAQDSFTDTTGKLEVSASGSAIYTLPIAMPPSAADTSPVISIVYSSGSFGGIVGQGWNINSISAISRIATRKDLDGYIDGVDFDDNDKLALDGQRLILKSGSYWASGSVYETETQSNTKIELIGSDEVMYFVVTAPDGSRSWYGNYNGGNATDMTSWYIIRFEDTNGNYITYSYDRPFGKSLCISQINFSGSVYGASTTLINNISFHYKSAQRSEFVYTEGIQHEKQALLERVEVHSDGQVFRTYLFTHSADTMLGYEKLIQIQEFNPENEAANPIILEYNTTQTNIEGSEYKTTYDNNLNFQEIVRSGDFDGDGRLDFITDNELYTKLFTGESGNLPVALPFTASTRQTFSATTLSGGQLQTAQSIVNAHEEGGSIQFQIYNVNNDIINPSYEKTVAINNTGLKSITGGCEVEGGSTYIKSSNKYLEGDFNGDGISEVLIIATVDEYEEYYPIEDLYNPDDSCHSEIHHSGYQAYLVDLHSDSPTGLGSSGYVQLEEVSAFGLGSFSQKYVADFNGDGKSDILSIKHDRTYEITGFKQLPTAPHVELEVLGSGTLLHYQAGKQLLFGDFNGDGKTDLMIPEAEHSEEWNIYYANPQPQGGEFFVEEAHNIVEYWPNSEDFYDTQTHFRNYYALDTNGDGKTDLVQVWRKHYKPPLTINDHDTQWRVTTFVNNIGNSGVGDGFTEDYTSPCTEFIVGTDCYHTSDSPDLPIPVVGNYRHMGANKELLMVRNHHDELTYIDFTKDVSKDNLLTKVTSSGGDQVYEILYESMEKGEVGPGSKLTPFYSVSNPAVYPYVTIEKSPHTQLVFALKHTAMGITRQQNFKYRNYTINMAGLGPMSFEKTARSAWFTDHNAPRLWSVQENDITLRGAPTRSYTKLSETGMEFLFSDDLIPPDVVQINTNSYETALSPNKVYSLLLSQKTATDLLSDTRTVTLYSYDPVYNLLLNTTTQYFSGQALQQARSVTTEFESNPAGAGAFYYIGRPDMVSTQTTAYGDVFTSEQRYMYDIKGNVIQIEKQGHQTEAITETMSYDNYGNITQKTLSAPGMASRTTQYQYDQNGRFVIQNTNTEGLQTQYTYDPLYGLVLTETNPYQLTTTYSYDPWGKKTRFTDYLGNSISYNYNKSAAMYTITQTGEDGTGSVSVSDILGRVIRSGSKDLNGNWSYMDIQYDEFSRKTAESEPYFGAPSQWNTFTYDNYHRPVQTTSYTGKISTITYNGLTTMVNDGTKTIVTTKDAVGNVISHSDSGGTITYTYYANGNLKQSDYDGVVISIQQDGWGRKTQLSDPSAGIYAYQYNAFGEITEETTPKGTTTYTYNNQGRLIKKEISGDATEMITDYSYNPQTKQLTTMDILSGSEVFTYTYTYDEYHRPVSTTEQTPHTQFEQTLQYDNFGRIHKEGYYALHQDSGKEVSHTIAHHYKNGSPWKITQDATGELLWETKTTNARGQLTEGIYGNEIIATHAYDTYGLPAMYSHDKSTEDGTANLMLLEFEFNPQRGLLNSRSNSLFNWQEDFSYDNLDRLTGFTDNNGSHEQLYDNRGRITHNQGIGDYSYSTTHPYQAAQVELTPEAHTYYQDRGRQSISYNAFKKPVSIHIEGRERINFSYNTFKGRSAMFYGSDVEDPTERPIQKYYNFDGSMEIKANAITGETNFIFYLGGDAYNAPVVLKSDGTTGEYLYLHRDYLGSILAITDQNAEILEKRHFDAWGNIVHLQNGQNDDLDVLTLLDRGYTGHEHMQGVELIHMNGRLYDPLLHRFLAPDNYVQDPYNTQNFNRYGYVYNNPLSFTDPSGEIGVLAAVAIGAAVAAGAYTVTALTVDVPFTTGGLAKATLIGGFSGAVTFGVGQAATAITQLVPRITFQAFAHGMFQGTMTGIQGGNFWQGAAAGAAASVVSSLWSGGPMAKGGSWGGVGGKFAQSGVGTITFGTVSGGAGAALTGGNFWEGAATGFVVSVANHAAHTIERNKKFTFKKGKSPFEVKEYTWIGGGEFIEGDYGKLVIKPSLNSSSDFKGQVIESSGFSLGGGLGSPLELFAATRGNIYFDKTASGNNLLELFQDAKFIRIVAVSSVVKYTRIEAYTNSSMNVKLWHADMFGLGVVTMGIQSHRYPVNFQNKN